jgi:hypothetical protein
MVCPHGLPTAFGFRPMQSRLDVDSDINTHVLTVGYAIVIVKQPEKRDLISKGITLGRPMGRFGLKWNV